ncbi:MAG TPA: hypothetical protein VJQ55_14240 [Candidatus Binatia bacterium]|nr:hypothetical protein [Candidatus Binatia bacterium]
MAKAKSHEDEIQNGLRTLRAAGVPLDAPGPEVVPRLVSEVGKGKETDLAVIFSLGRIFDAAALAALVDIERQTRDKDIRKEIKRALFKLSQKGFAAPAIETPEAKTAAPWLRSDQDIEAYMSAVDGGGGRLIWIAKPHAGHGLQVIQAMLHDREGLLRFGGVHMRRKELRKMADEIKAQHGIAMIPVPWEFADRIIYEGYERAKGRGQTGLENFHQTRSILATGKPKETTHPIYEKLDAAQVREGAWREQSRRLLDEPELRYWILTDDWVQAFLPQLQEAQTSRLVLNPLQKEERFNAIVRDAVKNLCSGENGRAFKQRMEDMALYFHETKRGDQAELALAVALQVGEGDPGPLDVSFLTGLMQKSFAFFISQDRTKKEEAESSLIIKP